MNPLNSQGLIKAAFLAAGKDTRITGHLIRASNNHGGGSHEIS